MVSEIPLFSVPSFLLSFTLHRWFLDPDWSAGVEPFPISACLAVIQLNISR